MFIRTTGNIETSTCSTDNAISTDEYGDERQCQLDESAAESVHEECHGSVSKQQRKKRTNYAFSKKCITFDEKRTRSQT